MPKKPLDPNILPPETETPPSQGGWAPVLAAGTRGVSGLIGTGGILGAGASGLGELLAQAIEKSAGIGDFNLGRIGTEAAVGAVPFGKVAKSGELLYNLLRGGALAGVGEAGREYATTGEINPLAVGASSVIGGGSAAGMQKLLDFFSGGAAKVPGPAIETTSVPGGVQGAGKDRSVVRPIPSPKVSAPPRVSTEMPSRAPDAPPTQPGVFDPAEFDRVMGTGPAVPYGAAPEPPSGSFSRAQSAEARAVERAREMAERRQLAEGAEQARALDRQAKVREEAERAAAIQTEREAANLEPSTTFSETVSGVTPSGEKVGKTTRYAPEKPDAGNTPKKGALATALGVPPSAVGPRGGPQTFVPTPEPVTTPVPNPLGDMLGGQRVVNEGMPFRSRVDAAGAGYRDIKAAREAGEAVPEEGRRAAGRALQREGQEAGLPPRGPVPTVAPQAPDWVQKELSVVEKLKQLMSDQRGGGGEKGFAHPEVASSLFGGVLGGTTGYALGASDENDDINPIMSGLAGAFGGAALPHAPAIARGGRDVATDILEKGRESLGNLPDIGETALQAAEKLPNIQRFNLLASAPGLFSNAFLGPYGSVIMGALERGLSGDSRGWSALKEVGLPTTFLREMARNREEALRLLKEGELGRSELASSKIGTDLLDTAMATPGMAMTAGDVTARNALMRAGFLEDEARKMTLTTEPTTGFGRTIAHFGTGGDNSVGDRLLKVGTSLMAPFRRTPANIMERGFERMPGVGLAFQAGKGIPGRELAVQQGMGLGAGALGYAAGSEIDDPTTSREARRALSNLSGMYSLPTSIGFALGRSQNESLPTQRPGSVTRELFPVPATENLDQLSRMFSGSEGASRTPRGLTPAILREGIPQLGVDPPFPDQEASEALPRLPSLRRR